MQMDIMKATGDVIPINRHVMSYTSLCRHVHPWSAVTCILLLNLPVYLQIGVPFALLAVPTSVHMRPLIIIVYSI